jgi:predicted RNA binding protein YcfA (HicA-like mRNA interferase family)
LPKIPPVTSVELIKIVQLKGFQIVRQKGSHVILINKEKNRIVVPVHPGKEIKPGLLRAILREAGISREDFDKLLKEK